MGIYIAEEFAKYGANVTLIMANTKIEPNFAIKELKVKTSKEMFETIKKNINCNLAVLIIVLMIYLFNLMSSKKSK